MTHKGNIFGATMLVAGTCIGGGMLALPVVTGEAGFFPSLLMICLGWGFMTLTALYLAEVNLWMGKGAHIITMASRFLGPFGRVVAWLLYLFMGYATLVAYTAGGSELFQKALAQLFHLDISASFAIFLFIFFFGTIVYLGNIVVGRVNNLLMVGLVVAYLLLVFSGIFYVQGANLLRHHFGGTIMAVPLLLTIFSFQTIIPSLTIYLNQDGRALRRSIIWGTGMALVVYLIWEFLVLGAVPFEGAGGLLSALSQGRLSTECLGIAIGNRWVCLLADFFAFFALVTSFLGIALGLFDFLADGLKIERKKWGKIILGLLVAIPTFLFTLSFEKIFLRALDITGGVGDAILNGILPCLMVWVGRYRENMVSEYRVAGGRFLILVAIGYATFVFTVEILGKLGVVVSV